MLVLGQFQAFVLEDPLEFLASSFLVRVKVSPSYLDKLDLGYTAGEDPCFITVTEDKAVAAVDKVENIMKWDRLVVT